MFKLTHSVYCICSQSVTFIECFLFFSFLFPPSNELLPTSPASVSLLHHWQCRFISGSRRLPNSRPSWAVTHRSRCATVTGRQTHVRGHRDLSIYRETWRGLSVQPCWWISRHLTDKERQASRQKTKEIVGEIGGCDAVTATFGAVVVCLSVHVAGWSSLNYFLFKNTNHFKAVQTDKIAPFSFSISFLVWK